MSAPTGNKNATKAASERLAAFRVKVGGTPAQLRAWRAASKREGVPLAEFLRRSADARASK